MSAKDCLRHPWLASNKRAPKSKKQTTSPTTSSTELNRSRVGCSSCAMAAANAQNTQHQQNLRKYLSKSREALFERVISKHKQHSVENQAGQQNLRKSTLISQYDKTRRMCESQMSLVSKSRERLLQGSMMAPSITRSREKLYGLKSLSKSHEVLNLCKTVLASSNDNKKPLDGLLKTLTRATTTADLIPINNDVENDKPEEKNLQNQETSKEEITTTADEGPQINKEPVIASLPTLPEFQPLQTVLTLIRNNRNFDKTIDEKTDDNKENMRNKDHTLEGEKEQERLPKPERPKLCITKQLSVISSEGDSDLHSPAISQTDSLSLTEGLSSINSSDSDVSEEDNDNASSERISQGDVSDMFDDEDVDEPRFTVKQLISAYNMHQEIVTKTSLEVTMNVSSPDQKILPVIEKIPNKKFPTGPNALRLFIPDLYISRTKRASSRRGTTTTMPEEDNESLVKIDEKRISVEFTDMDDPQTKKHSLPLDQPRIDTQFNRSCSLSSETSCDKTSGISSTLTSNEELNPNTPTTMINNTDITRQRKVSTTTIRSNRSSGVASNDGDVCEIDSPKIDSPKIHDTFTAFNNNKQTNQNSTNQGITLKNVDTTINNIKNESTQFTNNASNTPITSSPASSSLNKNTTQNIPIINLPTSTTKTTTEPTTKHQNTPNKTDRLNIHTTYTPRMNRKSFPSTRTPTPTNQTTEKTRRKSNPVMKPPFYS